MCKQQIELYSIELAATHAITLKLNHDVMIGRVRVGVRRTFRFLLAISPVDTF